MAVLAVVAVLVLSVGFALRERQLARDRAATEAALQELRTSLEGARNQLRRANEDLFVIQTLLGERNLLDENDLARARLRLIDAPRRVAEEKAAMARHLKVSPTQLVIDPSDSKIH
jgi:hypothetical protein